MERIELGTFQNISGRLRVTDPCYNKNGYPNDCGWAVDAVKGTWKAAIDKGSGTPGWGIRNHVLYAYHENSKQNYNILAPHRVGVDSDQVGIFDNDFYPDDPHDTPFYDAVCGITLSKPYAGVHGDFGCVSSSGYGDGVYKAMFGLDEHGLVDCIAVYFIEEDEEEEDEDDYCFDCGEYDCEGECNNCDLCGEEGCGGECDDPEEEDEDEKDPGST